VDKRSFSRGLKRSYELLKFASADQYFSNPSSFNVAESFRSMCFDKSIPYERLYLEGLKNSQYNILLLDYAYLQFSRGHESLRYAYYPNPFLGAETEKVSEVSEMSDYLFEGVIDMEEYLHMISEIRNSQHPPLTRYEYAPAQYKEYKHPCSHFHIGHHSDNRWSVRRELTPQSFTLTILKHYYSSLWDKTGEIKTGRVTVTLEDIYTKLRAECNLVPPTHFSANEERQFHWA